MGNLSSSVIQCCNTNVINKLKREETVKVDHDQIEQTPCGDYDSEMNYEANYGINIIKIEDEKKMSKGCFKCINDAEIKGTGVTHIKVTHMRETHMKETSFKDSTMCPSSSTGVKEREDNIEWAEIIREKQKENSEEFKTNTKTSTYKVPTTNKANSQKNNQFIDINNTHNIKKKTGALYLSVVSESPMKLKSLVDITYLKIRIVSRKKAYRCLPKFDIDENGIKMLIPQQPKYQSQTANMSVTSTPGHTPDSQSLNLKGPQSSGLFISEDFPSIRSVKEIISTSLNEEQIAFVERILREEDIISDDMGEDIVTEIFNAISFIKILANTVIYTKGGIEHVYYIIDSGRLEYSIDGKLDYLVKGDSLGTKALDKSSSKECFLRTKDTCYLFSLPLEAYKNSLINSFQKERLERINTLRTFPIFKNLEKKELTQLASRMRKCYFNFDSGYIVNHNQIPKNLYIILEGNILCTKGDKDSEVIKTLFPKECFCDIQLFCYIESYYNYIAEDVAVLYQLPYEDIIDIIGKDYIQKFAYSIYSHCIQKSEHLGKYVTGENLKNIFEVFQLKYYFADTVIPPKTRKICIILSGKLLKVVTNGTVYSPYNSFSGYSSNNHMSFSMSTTMDRFAEVVAESGDLYGEALIDQSEKKRHGSEVTFVSEDECIVFEASWTDMMKSIRSDNCENLSLYEGINILKAQHFFSNLTEMKLYLLSGMIKFQKFKPNEVLIKEGPVSDKLYMIRKGKVKVLINNIHIKDLEQGAYFGDITNSPDFYSKKACFLASDRVECYTLDKDAYEEIIDSSIEKPIHSVMVLKDITIQIDQLYYLKELGYGSYGKVYLTHNKKKFYAVKTSEIQFLCKNKNLTHYYLAEKGIMSSIDHPFVVQLINTLKNEDYIFFILEFIDGITLKNYLLNKRRDMFRNIYESTFYTAILLTAVNYLQRKKIIHRDLKPDNCMIDKTGYLKIIDFGVAQDMSGKDYTHTILGTPHYMAPETLLGKGYNYSVDYWAIGVILYEIFYGALPFGHNSEDLAEIYQEIIEKKLSLPNDQRFTNLNNFIQLLLTKNPLKRVCSFKKLRSHSLFENFNFEKLMEFKLAPPYIPKNGDSDPKNLNNLDYPFEHFIKNNIVFTSRELKDEDEENLNKQFEMLSDF